MKSLSHDLRERLDQLRQEGLYRCLRPVEGPQGVIIRMDGKEVINAASNDYLGFANHPALRAAAREALDRYGVGSGASRLICGTLAPHAVLEQALADFKGTESAVVFSSGYATALGTITALLESQDILILDKHVHACVVDAARLSGARLRIFRHNDPADLETKLRWASQERCKKSPASRVMVVTESLFSMDGEVAPLAELVALKEKYGAWLMVDEAHATGLYGARRRGLLEAFGLEERVEVQMGTLGKSLGSAGGYICGSRILIDFLVNRARSFIFSTAPLPAASAAAGEAVKRIQSSDGAERGHRLRLHLEKFRPGQAPLLPKTGLPPALTPIIPIMIGEEGRAVEIGQKLWQGGIYLPAIRYPTVSRGKARLRLTLSAAHTDEQVNQILKALASLGLNSP